MVTGKQSSSVVQLESRIKENSELPKSLGKPVVRIVKATKTAFFYFQEIEVLGRKYVPVYSAAAAAAACRMLH